MSADDADTTPAVSAPDGWVSDLDHPKNQYNDTVITVALCLIITIPLVGARLFTKIRLHRETKTEDWLLVAAEITFIAFLSLLLALPGRGAHEWDVSLTTANSFAFFVNILELVYIVPLLLSKIALILQLKRIFTAGSAFRTPIYWLLQLLIVANLVSYAALIIWAIVFITHQSQDFDPNCTGECHNSNYVLVATGIFNAVVDLATIAIPLWAVRGLHMTLRKKLGVAAVFGVGGLACAASILRAITSFEPINNEMDQTYTSFPLLYWAAAEIAAVIAATSIPCLPRLWRKIHEKYLQRGGNSMAVNYTVYERRQRKYELDTLGTMGTATVDEGRPSLMYRPSDPEEAVSEADPDLGADGDVALIQGRMRGLGLGMGSSMVVQGGCPAPLVQRGSYSAGVLAGWRRGGGEG